jgi:hypothetical protein
MALRDGGVWLWLQVLEPLADGGSVAAGGFDTSLNKLNNISEINRSSSSLICLLIAVTDSTGNIPERQQTI